MSDDFNINKMLDGDEQFLYFDDSALDFSHLRNDVNQSTSNNDSKGLSYNETYLKNVEIKFNNYHMEQNALRQHHDTLNLNDNAMKTIFGSTFLDDFDKNICDGSPLSHFSNAELSNFELPHYNNEISINNILKDEDSYDTLSESMDINVVDIADEDMTTLAAATLFMNEFGSVNKIEFDAKQKYNIDDDDDNLSSTTVESSVDESSSKAEGNNYINDFPPDVVYRAMNSVSKAKVDINDSILNPFNETSDESVRKEELKGTIEFHLYANSVTNSINKNTKMVLLKMRTLFAQQLPEMPMEYITEIIFDPTHKTLTIIKNKEPIGGICFKMFPRKNFVEIVFCAVKFSQQVKGYGSHLMNHLKDYLNTKGIKYMLTYADCNAVGYFKKQGFTTNIQPASIVYNGYIKEYENATLMQCELHPEIVYTQFTSVVRKQSSILKQIITQQEKQPVHSGLNCFKHGLQSLPIEYIPGIRGTGWNKNKQADDTRHPYEVNGNSKKLAGLFGSVLQSVRRQASAWPFLEPVCAKMVPDYYDIIKYPMDLKTMGERLNRGYYNTCRLFLADMTRIFTNCHAYNAEESVYPHLANTLQKYFMTKMREMGLLPK